MTTLDLNQGVLVLQLDMSLDAGLTIDCTQIGINSASGDPGNVYPLSSPAATPVADEVSCALGADLVITIATDPNFSSDVAGNTFVYINSGTGIMVGGTELPSDMVGRMVDNVIGDITRPELISFDLDLSQNELTLAFSEPVDASTFDPSAAVIQSTSSSPTESLTLTTQSMAQGSNAATMVVELNEDANLLKAMSLLATSTHNTYLSFSQMLIQDLFGNPIVQIDQSSAIAVSSYTPDSVSPEVVSFDLDLDTGVLTLCSVKQFKLIPLCHLGPSYNLPQMVLVDHRNINSVNRAQHKVEMQQH